MRNHAVFRSRHTFRYVVGIAAMAFALGTPPRAVFAQAATGGSTVKIGIIGSGNLGGAVGALWVKSGHPVLFSSRHPEELKKLTDGLGPLARAGTVREALTFGDVVFVAVPYGAYPQLGKDYAREFAGKIVLDAGNAVPARDGEIVQETREKGIGVTSAKYLAGARIVRAFNTMNFRRLTSNANRPGARMAIPIAGDDEEAIAVAQRLIRDAGFDPVLIGGLADAKLFAQGAPLYGQDITAQEMQERLRTLR